MKSKFCAYTEDYISDVYKYTGKSDKDLKIQALTQSTAVYQTICGTNMQIYELTTMIKDQGIQVRRVNNELS